MKILPIPAEEKGQTRRELVDHALLGNLDALYSTAHRLVGSADLAQDLVQETARKALNAQPDLRGERAARAWLFRILINGIRDYFRRRKLWEELDPENEDWEAAVNDNDITLAAVQDVRRALGLLRPATQILMILVDVEEFTIAEAANMLRVPPGTAASRLARARTELRAHLEVYGRKSAQRGNGV